MESQITQPSHRRHSNHDGSRPPGSEDSSSHNNITKLGDFTKLRPLPIWCPPKKAAPSTASNAHVSVPSDGPAGSVQPDKLVKLGDFSKLLDQLATSGLGDPSPSFVPGSSQNATPVKTAERLTQSLSIPAPPSSKPSSLKNTVSRNTLSGLDSLAVLGVSSGSDSDPEPSTYTTPASSPSSSTTGEPSPLAKLAKEEAKEEAKKGAKDMSNKCVKTLSATTRRSPVIPTGPRDLGQLLFSYQTHSYGSMIPVYDRVPTQEAKHASLMHKLIHESAVDNFLHFKNPSLIQNGIHVFVDMSNIVISFQKALRAKYLLAETVRLRPLPSLNISFFNELLVRQRHAKVLNAGCSMHPNHPEPDYVQDLRSLDYRVDLRYRRVDGSQGPEEARMASGHPRYVEDMVDETLQTRIGESVMQYFGEPGTLVLATGDARPAKFSDGFFTYADRALKMGWNVEVVSWKLSLSGAWTNLLWARQWGDRFRVIELDSYLDDLFQSYVS